MFLICLTHDIDQLEHPFSSFRGLAKGVLDAQTAKLAINYLAGKPSARKNPYDTFDRILELEHKYNATSTFFVVPADNYVNRNCIHKLSAAGSEIALHSIGLSYASPSQLMLQKRIIEKLLGSEIIGARSHRLDLMIPRTFEFQRSCGFKYDASYFPPRYGNKRLYAPFFGVEGLLELPLAFMDSDFAEMPAMGSGGVKAAWRAVERVLEEYRKNEGICTILWHPPAFYDEKNDFHKLRYGHFRGFERLYEMILQYGTDNCDEMCSCVEVMKRWKPTEESMW